MIIMSGKLLFSCGVTESLMSLLRQRKRKELVSILPSQPAQLHRYRIHAYSQNMDHEQKILRLSVYSDNMK